MWAYRGDEELHSECSYRDSTRVTAERGEYYSSTLTINVTEILSRVIQNTGFIELLEVENGYECETLLKCNLIESTSPHKHSIEFHSTKFGSAKLACDVVNFARSGVRQHNGT
ncbi:unnamed protein product [Arctia plantaginis]|uniref:Uncharacterized protein n=1 Tax=Arctia plantaginis TaxID=874455 RepID=A0A8S1AVP9_ARCPL|nr:unnamed protein product [Arctia plantaginis]